MIATPAQIVIVFDLDTHLERLFLVGIRMSLKLRNALVGQRISGKSFLGEKRKIVT